MAVYKKITLVGTSENTIEEAVERALERASRTIRNIGWFEVKEIRGSVADGRLKEYQVVLEVGFRIEGDTDLG